MIASLDQRMDFQVKCDRSILFGAAKREVVVKTTTMTKGTTTAAVAVKYIQKRRKKAKPSRINPKNRTLIVDRTPAKEPNL